MASEILGLFTTPQQYQQQQQDVARARAMEFARLDPFQKASAAIGQGAYGLAGAIGGALGGQDPQLKMISQRQALANQLDPNDPASYMKVAQSAAQMGDQQFAILIADAGRKAASEYALISQRTREKQGADPFEQLVRSGKYTPASMAAYKTSQNVADLREVDSPDKTPAKIIEARTVALGKGFTEGSPEFNTAVVNYLERPEKPEPRPSVGSDREAIALDEFDKNYYDLTPIQRAEVNKKVDEKKIKEAKATATPAAQQAKQVLQSKTDIASKIENEALTASDQITLAQSLRELAPKAFTGFASNAKLSASKVATAFGIPTKGGSESEIIDQILGQMTIGAAGQLKGALSDKDVLFLKQTIGNRGLSVDTLLYVADEIERRALQNRNLNQRINKFVGSGGSLNDLNFETEKTKSSAEVKKKYTEYRDILKKVTNNTATLEEAKRAKDIRDELGL